MERHSKRRRNSVKQIASSIQTRSKSKTRNLASDFSLPDDCWESIFKFIFNDGPIFNSCYIKSLSLVSKQFLCVGDRLILSLSIRNSTCPFLPSFFQRFTNLISLKLSNFNYTDALLCEISSFPLRLTSLKLKTIPVDGLRALSQNITTLTSLTCSYVKSINDTDLFLIADCFPLLEELDLRYSKNINLANYESLRNGLMTLSSTLLKLRKVNLTGHYYINGQLLFHLFNNWKLLEEANISCCHEITNAGIASALRERPTLRSLSFSDNFELMERANTFFTLPALVSNSPSLSEINLQHTYTKSVENSNHLMDVVESPQLKSLCLADSYGLRDESLKIIVSLFPNLQFLNLSNCRKISEKVIYQVLKKCCKIRHLDLTGLELKFLGWYLKSEVANLEVLNLSQTEVDDRSLYEITKSCGGLTQLLLKYCLHVTENGVKHVMENCTQLREINLKGCSKVDGNVVASMVLSRPLLREIIPPKCPVATCQRPHRRSINYGM